MNLFKSIMKWISVSVYACFLATIAYAATLPEPIKLYVVYSYKFDERTIQKIFLKKENAKKYCDTYKESHNYTFEEVTVNE